MKITFLDYAVVNPGDISWSPLERLGDLTIYKRTPPDMAVRHIGDAQAIFTDSVAITRETMKRCPELKFIGAAATGYNHIDLSAAAEYGIAVYNVPAYSTESVAQHTFALLLAVSNRVDLYQSAIRDGEWSNCPDYSFFKAQLFSLAGKSMGIIGYGNIGKRVGEIAACFGMTVNVYSRDKEAVMQSDVISLHCPLTEGNHGMVDQEFIDDMKDGAILINTARGGLIDEEALADSLKTGKLAGAGLDVLKEEPPPVDNPLIGLDNCYITPHIGFASLEARVTIFQTCAANLERFMKGGRENKII